MTSPPNTADTAQNLPGPNYAVGERLDEASQVKGFPDTFGPIVVSIAWAGGVYPIVAAIVFLISSICITAVALLNGTSAVIDDVLLVEAALYGLFFAVLYSIVSLAWAGVVALLTMPVAFLFVLTLRVRVNVTRFGAVCGGIVGFLAVLPPLFIGDPLMNWPSELLFWLFWGPFLTTPIGQVGGAWGGLRASTKYWPEQDYKRPISENHLYRFSLRQMLLLSTWLGLLLAAIHLVKIPFELILPLLFGWLIYQAVTLYVGWLVICHLWPRWRVYRKRRYT